MEEVFDIFGGERACNSLQENKTIFSKNYVLDLQYSYVARKMSTPSSLLTVE